MPALITHRLFGEESIDRLPAGIISTEEERRAFLLANQGPDPFFFRVRTPHLSACMELARRMHRSRMSRQFAAIREGVTHLPEADTGIGRAFALGLLSHYALDRCAHPFVYAQQWGIQAADADLAEAGGQVHAVIESDLDVLMLQLKRDGATAETYPPAHELVCSPRIARVGGALTSFCARRVYDMEIDASEYGGAVADMQAAYRLIEPAGSPRNRLLSRIEGLTKRYPLLQALAHRVTTEAPAGAGNLAERTWEDPFTGARSTMSFPALFEHALDDYETCAMRFIETADMEAVTRHVNYSGRPLAADEEFDREE